MLSFFLTCPVPLWGEIGQVSFFISSSCPSGWLSLSGQNVTEPTAFINVIRGSQTTGAVYLPDVNGVTYSSAAFIRGWNSTYRPYWYQGDGYSYPQLDAFQGHFHQVYDRSAGSLRHYTPIGSSGIYYESNTNNFVRQAISDGVNGIPRIAVETRPTNYSFLACVHTTSGDGIIEKEVLPMETQNLIFALFFLWLIITGFRLGKN